MVSCKHRYLKPFRTVQEKYDGIFGNPPIYHTITLRVALTDHYIENRELKLVNAQRCKLVGVIIISNNKQLELLLHQVCS